MNRHLEGPLSHDCMQGSENTGSNKTSNLKMSKFKRAFIKGGMGRASDDNDWDSGMGIRHSTEGGTKQEPLVSISPPNPQDPHLDTLYPTQQTLPGIAFYCAFSFTEDAHLRLAHIPLFISCTASNRSRKDRSLIKDMKPDGCWRGLFVYFAVSN